MAKSKITKKNKRNIGIFLMIVGLLALMFSFTDINFFSIYQEPVFDDVITSDYIIKFGLKALNFQETDPLNDFVDYGYGYLIFDSPLILKDDFKSDFKRKFKEDFSQDLPNSFAPLLESKELDAFYFNVFEKAFEDTIDAICQSVKTVGIDAPDDQIEQLKDFCSKKGDVIIKEGLSGKRILKLPDIDEYRTNIIEVCDEDLLDPEYTKITFPPNGDPIEYRCKRVYEGAIKTGNKIRLSDLKVELYERGGNIILAFGDKGIQEANNIPAVYRFEQLAYYVNHDECEQEILCRLSTNSDNVVDASNGKIKKESRLSDLWYGVTSGKVLHSPRTITKSILIIAGLVLLLFGWYLYKK